MTKRLGIHTDLNKHCDSPGHTIHIGHKEELEMEALISTPK